MIVRTAGKPDRSKFETGSIDSGERLVSPYLPVVGTGVGDRKCFIRRLLPTALAAALSLTLLSGCGASGADAGAAGTTAESADGNGTGSVTTDGSTDGANGSGSTNGSDSATASGSGSVLTVSLDPNNPVSLTIWHYYNGAQQAAFDELVSEFNETVGKDEGVYVEGYSQGSVSDLETAITDAVAGKVGSQELPDLFSTYADTAYEVEHQGRLVDLTQYFSDEELSEYVDSYVQEGYFDDDGALYLFPVAKSTEIMMINKTDWEPFARATGASLDDLATTEGIARTAKAYYEWTDSLTPDVEGDGKAFYGRDSMSNYFIIGMKQMGTDLFDVENGQVTIRAEKDQIRRLWDNYYVPYVNGYFASAGEFRSDDVKTGEILAYTGSSASSMYFPDQVEDAGGTSRAIAYIVLPAPVMEGGEQVQVQQGASMAVTSSDPEHEYAACQFLRWFTAKENNLRFVCDAAYFPVRKEANSVGALDRVIAEQNLTISSKAYDCLTSVMERADEVTCYTPKCFASGYDTRKVLDYNLSDKAVADKAAIDEAVAGGASRAEAAADYVTDEAFDAWYEALVQTLNEKAGL